MEYCTIDEALATVVQFQNDYDNNVIDDTMINSVIVEASEMARAIFSPIYSIAAIDAESPNFPPGLVYWTKLQSSLLLINYRGSVDQSQSIAIKKNALEESKRMWESSISNGFLQKANGEMMQMAIDPSYQKSPVFTEQVAAMYARGPREY